MNIIQSQLAPNCHQNIEYMDEKQNWCYSFTVHQAVAGDTSKWHFEHHHLVQTQIWTRSDITIYKTYPVSSDIQKQT